MRDLIGHNPCSCSRFERAYIENLLATNAGNVTHAARAAKKNRRAFFESVVLLKALESKGLLESVNGRIAIGWLVVEDLAMVLVLVLLPPLAGVAGGSAWCFANQNSAIAQPRRHCPNR